MTVPFMDLRAQHAALREELLEAMARAVDACQFVLGPDVAAFEEEFASYCQADFAVGVNSGTSALHLALLAAGVGPGDEVITVPYTFVATVAAVGYTGARAVLVDVDPLTYNMDVTKVEALITERTKVIMPVHLYGQPADMDPLLEIARRHGLVVVEDAAQAHGAEYKGRRVGAIGDIGCFSFYPGKNLGACGEGGAVTTNNKAYHDTLRMLRDWGQDRKYHHQLKGFNYRMEGLQGAALRVKLRYLDRWTEVRRARAAAYDERLAGAGVRTPQVADYVTRHVYHIYTLWCQSRDRLREALETEGIQTALHYPIPVHLQPAHADLGYGEGAFPEAERAAGGVLSLPCYPEMEERAVPLVADAVRRIQASLATA